MFVLGACGGGSTLSKEEATGVMQAALTASQEANKQVGTGLTGAASADVKVELSDKHFSVEGKVTGPDGGTAEISGEGDKSEGGFDASLSIKFDNWKVQGKDLVLSGDLEQN